jgi:phosphopantetheinyl transferase
MIELELPEAWRGVAMVIEDADLSLASQWFGEEELGEYGAFRLEKRRREWLSSRIAAKRLALAQRVCGDPRHMRVGRAAGGRPLLFVDGVPSRLHLSISHSGPYAAAALSETPVGIDVEELRPTPKEAAAHLFLDSRELDELQRCALDARMLHFWSAKEAAWKQRSEQFGTLRQTPLRVIAEHDAELHFEYCDAYSATVQTLRTDRIVVALAR